MRFKTHSTRKSISFPLLSFRDGTRRNGSSKWTIRARIRKKKRSFTGLRSIPGDSYPVSTDPDPVFVPSRRLTSHSNGSGYGFRSILGGSHLVPSLFNGSGASFYSRRLISFQFSDPTIRQRIIWPIYELHWAQSKSTCWNFFLNYE